MEFLKSGIEDFEIQPYKFPKYKAEDFDADINEIHSKLNDYKVFLFIQLKKILHSKIVKSNLQKPNFSKTIEVRKRTDLFKDHSFQVSPIQSKEESCVELTHLQKTNQRPRLKTVLEKQLNNETQITRAAKLRLSDITTPTNYFYRRINQFDENGLEDRVNLVRQKIKYHEVQREVLSPRKKHTKENENINSNHFMSNIHEIKEKQGNPFETMNKIPEINARIIKPRHKSFDGFLPSKEEINESIPNEKSPKLYTRKISTQKQTLPEAYETQKLSVVLSKDPHRRMIVLLKSKEKELVGMSKRLKLNASHDAVTKPFHQKCKDKTNNDTEGSSTKLTQRIHHLEDILGYKGTSPTRKPRDICTFCCRLLTSGLSSVLCKCPNRKRRIKRFKKLF